MHRITSTQAPVSEGRMKSTGAEDMLDFEMGESEVARD